MYIDLRYNKFIFNFFFLRDGGFKNVCVVQKIQVLDPGLNLVRYGTHTIFSLMKFH